MIHVTRIDKHPAFLTDEIVKLRAHDKPWARSKAEKLEALRQDLQTIRRDQQMTGMNGRRIE